MTKILTNRFVRGLACSVRQRCSHFLSTRRARRRPVPAMIPPRRGRSHRDRHSRESQSRARHQARSHAIRRRDRGRRHRRAPGSQRRRIAGARVGVQVDRRSLKGTSVSVRGLRQNVYLFNGRQIIDPTGRGGIGLETLGTSTFGLLALVPSELISRLELTKLASANQISGALGGIVDVQTPMPLDGPSRYGAKVGGIYTTRLPKAATRASASSRRSSRMTRSACCSRRRTTIATCHRKVSTRSRVIPASRTARAPCVSVTRRAPGANRRNAREHRPQRRRAVAGQR